MRILVQVGRRAGPPTRASRRRAGAARRGSRRPARRAARRRCAPPSGAGRASRTGPGTPSGYRAGPGAVPRRGSAFRSRPSSARVPEVGRSSAITSRASVDLPEPDSPTTPRLRPASIVRLTPLSACTFGAGREQALARQRVVADQVRRPRAAAPFMRRLQLAAASAASRRRQRAWWPGPIVNRRRHGVAACGDGEAAALGERAAGRQVDQLGHRAGDRRQPRARAPRRAWAAPRTGPACRDAPCGRTPSPVGPLSTTLPPYITSIRATFCGDHAQVVRDQQQRHAALGDQVGDQVEDLALDRHVQRRRRLVGDQQVGPAGQRHGDRHALALAARELVRIGVDAPRGVGHADAVEQRDAPACAPAAADRPRCSRSGSATWRPIVCTRVQRRHRLLEDHADAVAAQSAQLGVALADEFLAVEADAAGDHGALGQQAQQRQRGDRLAAARFADQAQRLAALRAQKLTPRTA